MDRVHQKAGSEGQPQSQLLRVLGTGSIIGIVIGTMIGSGIFIVPATVAAEVRAPLVMLAVWIVGGVFSIFGALSLAELAGSYSESGGLYVYLREAYGPLMGFLFGWTLFLVIDSGAFATLAVAFSSKYLPHFFPMTEWGSKAASVALILGLLVINTLGVKKGALVQNVLTFIKFAGLVGISGIVLLSAKGSWAHFTHPGAGELGGGLVGKFGMAMVATLWAYKGFEMATFNAGETRNPARSFPLGIIVGSGIVIFLYLLANAAYLYVIPAGEMAVSNRIATDAMNAAVGPLGASIISFIILFSIAGAANSHMLTGPRVYYAMAMDGLFFKRMADVHPKYRTPHISILILGAWSIVLSLSGTFEELLTYVVFGHWIFMGLAVGAVMILRRKRPDLPRSYRTLGYPVTPVLFILAALYVTGNALISAFWNCFVGVLLIAAGIPAYLFWKRGRTKINLYNRDT